MLRVLCMLPCGFNLPAVASWVRARHHEADDVGSVRASPKGHRTKLVSAAVGGPYEVLKCCRAPPSRRLNATNFRIAENTGKAHVFAPAAFAASRAAGAQIISENTRRYGLSNAPGLVQNGGPGGQHGAF